MPDKTMHLQGWHKLMTPKATKPRKISKKQRAIEQARWDARADEAIAWVERTFPDHTR